jgi:hypothetical protein
VSLKFSGKLPDRYSMTNGKLQKTLDAATKAASRITDELIAAGRGNERPSETFKKSDPLSLRLQANARERHKLLDELTRRGLR